MIETRALTSLHVDTARTWRGGQHQVLQTVSGLNRLHHPSILVARRGGALASRAPDDIRSATLRMIGEFDVFAAWQLRRLVLSTTPDVVHVHDPGGVALIALALSMGPAIHPRPLVVASRRVDFHLKRHTLSRWKYGHTDVFIAVSRVIRDMLIEDGIPADRIDVVYEGANVRAIGAATPLDVRATFSLPPEALVVGNVAALVPHKGQRDLIDAAAIVVQQIPQARFVILGEGPLMPEFAAQVAALGLERHVLLPGFRTDVLGLQKTFDVFVMSSITEGMGTAMLDAMACGTALVGTLAGGIPEAITDGDTGLLVPIHEPRAMATAIVRLLNDASLRSALGARARQRMESTFSADHMVAQTLDVYERRLRRPVGESSIGF